MSDLQELAKNPKNRVLVPVHDTIFEPWPSTKIKACVDKIVAIVKRPSLQGDATRIRDTCMKDDDLVHFAAHHNLFFDKLTDPESHKDPRFIPGILKLVELRASVELGVLEEGEDANKAAMAAMLQLTMGS